MTAFAHLMNQEQRDLILRNLDDLVEQSYAVLESRGCQRRVIRRSWIEWWLQRGETPLTVANIALGYRRPDAHLGGIDS